MTLDPSLEFANCEGVTVLTDEAARDEGVSIVFTTRLDGTSAKPFDSLNLSTRMGDDPDSVAANRERVARAMGVDPASLRMPRQVHGARVVECGESSDLGDADAVVARGPAVTAGVLTADCVPVLLWGPNGVAAVHAGWRGIVAGVVDAALGQLGGEAAAAWVGPSIKACCYEVGPDVTSAFEGLALPITDPWHVDPSQAVCAQLRRSGVERIAATNLCTSCDRRFFSHRRDPVTGRQGAFIALL